MGCALFVLHILYINVHDIVVLYFYSIIVISLNAVIGRL